MARKKSGPNPFEKLEGLAAEVERQQLRMGILPFAQRVEMDQLRAKMFDAIASGSESLPELKKRQASLSDKHLRDIAQALKVGPKEPTGPILMRNSSRLRALKPISRPFADDEGTVHFAALTAACPPTGVCIPMDISFIDDGFNVVGPPNPASQGIIGFGVNTGRGGVVNNVNQGMQNDQLHLVWTAIAPNDGVCTLDVTTPIVLASGWYVVTGDYWRPGTESQISLFVRVTFSVNVNFFAAIWPLVVDGTPDMTKSRNFSQFLDLPGQDFTFPVQAGDTIQYTLSLIADTFSSDSGIVSLVINNFGIPANADETLFRICE
jgi:hypothetical protein